MPPTTLEALEAAALQLSAAERSQLAERLLVSLEEDDEICSPGTPRQLNGVRHLHGVRKQLPLPAR